MVGFARPCAGEYTRHPISLKGAPIPTALEPFAAFERLWTFTGGDAGALERARLTGRDPVLPWTFAVGTAALAAVGASGLAAEPWTWADGSGAAGRRRRSRGRPRPFVPLGTHEPAWSG